jgi:hypothetical protein
MLDVIILNSVAKLFPGRQEILNAQGLPTRVVQVGVNGKTAPIKHQLGSGGRSRPGAKVLQIFTPVDVPLTAKTTVRTLSARSAPDA